MDAHVDAFHRQGYVILPDVLTAGQCARLRDIIDAMDAAQPKRRRSKGRHPIHRRVFEQHPRESLDVFRNARVLGLCKRLLGVCGSSRGKGDRCLATHVMHNNAFCVRPGGRGMSPSWHTDDAPLFTTDDGGPLPPGVTVAPMVLTCMYYLNDVRGPQDGMTHVIPGSHRLGRPCTREDAEAMACVAPAVTAGSVLVISSSVWHRGASVPPDGRDRYVFQVSYGRRLVGHKYGTIMNYVLPEGVEALLETEEDRTLMGFLQGGPYG